MKDSLSSVDILKETGGYTETEAPYPQVSELVDYIEKGLSSENYYFDKLMEIYESKEISKGLVKALIENKLGDNNEIGEYPHIKELLEIIDNINKESLDFFLLICLNQSLEEAIVKIKRLDSEDLCILKYSYKLGDEESNIYKSVDSGICGIDSNDNMLKTSIRTGSNLSSVIRFIDKLDKNIKENLVNNLNLIIAVKIGKDGLCANQECIHRN